MNNFLDFVTDTTGKFADNGAAALLIELLRQCSDDDSDGFIETVECLSNGPNFGSKGEAAALTSTAKTGVLQLSMRCAGMQLPAAAATSCTSD